MSSTKKLYDLLLAGDCSDTRFDAMDGLLKSLGFGCRVKGDHHIYTMEGVIEIINLQPENGKLKKYQIRQVARIITQYKIGGDDQ